jgi:predicted transglutaminase-like cysteine proteinase
MRAALPMLVLATLTATSAQALPVLDAGRWSELEAVNRAVNALPSASDRARFGVDEYWEPADGGGGDCEDKALAARATLLAQGWPAESLRLALAWTEAHELHAVLTVEVMFDAQPATYVLDSRFPWVLAWDALSRSGYTWLTRQAGDGRWRKIASP